ncbi:MAG TPA: amidohydrolase family protein [Acidimicrobiales bacterium]|nr:amidohydrolase family protein [Acidimicrobiales bacterium]
MSEPLPVASIISVDDHLIEPPDLFEGRMPSYLVDRAPRIVEFEDGRQAWVYEDQLFANVGLNAVVGRPKEEWSMEPARFEEMRPGCFDIAERVKDMDAGGIWASVCFPSLIAGFCGAVFSRSKDPELGLACLRAWNDWHLEAWAGSAPDRIIPLQLAWLADPEIAADDVRRNAERGFKAVSFAEIPAQLGFPSIHRKHWAPFLQACEETGTVLCLHTGSSGWAPIPSPDPPFEVFPTLFPASSLVAATDWLWSGVCTRYPDLKIAWSEGGIGWVVMLADRADYVLDHSASGKESTRWKGDLRPSEVLARNFWFCTIDDPGSVDGVLAKIGPDHVMVESDYPHADSTWPTTLDAFRSNFGHLPDDVVRKIAYENAASLFRHPLPPEARATAAA